MESPQSVIPNGSTMGVAQVPPEESPKTNSSLTLIPSAPCKPIKGASSPSTPRKSSRLVHACLNMTPAFFSLNMGTGITSILLHNLPYNAGWLERLGTVIFVLNIVIFVVLAFGNIVRYVMWKGLFTTVNTHPMAGLFWGCLPMGFATIVNMVAFVCVPAWGYRWAQLALGLWWIDVILSIWVNLGMIFMIFTRQTHTVDTVSAAWLLPIVSSVVAAASGGVVASALMPFDPILARSTIIVSYVVWGTGVPLACFIITLWIHRTAIGGIPAAGALPSLFLPLGPCGQGSFGIILLGRTMRDLAYEHGVGFAVAPTGAIDATTSIYRMADAVYVGGLVTGLVLWGLGFCWYIIATVITLDYGLRNKAFFSPKSFSIGWTAYTFPIGVFATATTILATELDSPAFKVIGTVISLQVALTWFYVFVMTLWKVWNGTIFVAPELAKFNGQPPLRWSREQPREVEKA